MFPASFGNSLGRCIPRTDYCDSTSPPTLASASFPPPLSFASFHFFHIACAFLSAICWLIKWRLFCPSECPSVWVSSCPLVLVSGCSGVRVSPRWPGCILKASVAIEFYMLLIDVVMQWNSIYSAPVNSNSYWFSRLPSRGSILLKHAPSAFRRTAHGSLRWSLSGIFGMREPHTLTLLLSIPVPVAHCVWVILHSSECAQLKAIKSNNSWWVKKNIHKALMQLITLNANNNLKYSVLYL